MVTPGMDILSTPVGAAVNGILAGLAETGRQRVTLPTDSADLDELRLAVRALAKRQLTFDAQQWPTPLSEEAAAPTATPDREAVNLRMEHQVRTLWQWMREERYAPELIPAWFEGDGQWTGSYSGASKTAAAERQTGGNFAIQHLGPREVDGDATTVTVADSVYNLSLAGSTLSLQLNTWDLYFDGANGGAIRGHFYKKGGRSYTTAVTADLSGLVSGKVGNHDLLNASEHPDTTDSTVVRGDLVVGNSTPAWTRLARGSDGQVLTVSGDDIAWADASGGASGNGVHSHNSEIKADVAGTWTLDDDYDYRGCIVLLYYANLGAGGGGGDSQVVLAPTQKRISDPPSADVMLITLGPDGPDIYVDKDDGSLYFTTTAGVADPYQIWVEASSNPARETFD